MEASRRNFLRGVTALGFVAVVAPKFPALSSEVLILRDGERVVGQTFVWPQRIIMLGNNCLVEQCDFVGLTQDELDAFVWFGASPSVAISKKAFVVGMDGLSGCTIRDSNFAGSIDQLASMKAPDNRAYAQIGFFSYRSPLA